MMMQESVATVFICSAGRAAVARIQLMREALGNERLTGRAWRALMFLAARMGAAGRQVLCCPTHLASSAAGLCAPALCLRCSDSPSAMGMHIAGPQPVHTDTSRQ